MATQNKKSKAFIMVMFISGYLLTKILKEM